MKAEQTISREFWISVRYPSLVVQLTLRVELPGPEYHSVGIHMNPSLIPSHLLGVLVTQGIDKGISDAIKDLQFPLSTSDVEVDVLDLKISGALESMADAEIQVLGNKLNDLAHEIVTMLLRPMSTTNRDKE